MYTKEVLVIDSIMGSGKTNYIIDYMNTHTEETFIYIFCKSMEVK